MQRLHDVGLPSEIENRRSPPSFPEASASASGLARALAIGPEVMLYDEPTTGLDPIMSDVINELILQTQRTMKTTGVVVTHDMKTVTKVADRVVMLYPLARLKPDEPQILYDGPPEQIECSADPRVGQFVRGEAGERLREMALLPHRKLFTKAGRADPRLTAHKNKGGLIMNERLMQFRIGMFVIVAGLVLTMMIIWFGESAVDSARPASISRSVMPRRRAWLKASPCARAGSGSARCMRSPSTKGPNQPDGVIVTLAIERKYKLHEGTKARVNRSLMGDVTIDMVPGTSPAPLEIRTSPRDAVFVTGQVAPDPAKALEAATKIFDSAGTTLASINEAANGIAKLSESAENIDGFLSSVTDAGQNVSKAAKRINDLVAANEGNLQPTLADLREVAAKLNKTLDPETQAALKAGVDHFASAANRLDAGLVQLDPVFKDLGATANHTPATDIGQAVRRINVLAADLELLSSKLRDGRGGLNPDGTLQKLLTRPELHDNFNSMALSANQTLAQLRAVLADLRIFADKVARDPSLIGRGALQSR